MQASDDTFELPTWAKIAYLILFALLALIAYRISSIWFGHIVVILLAFPLTWFIGPKGRRLARFVHLLFAVTLLLSTLFIRFLNEPQQVAAIERSGLLSFLIGGAGARALVSIVTALLASTTLLFTPLLIVAFTSTEWILALHEVDGVSRWQAMRLLLSVIFDTAYPYYVVEDGEITQTKPSGLLPMLGGPGVAVVKPYNAVIFERAGNITRIEGPGMFMTKRFEFVKGILDLRKQWTNFTAEDVPTKDNVPLTFHCGVGFRIEAARDTAKRVAEPGQISEGKRFTGVIAGEYPVYKWTIFRAIYNVTAAGWKLVTPGTVETFLRQVMREYSLESLYRLEGDRLVEAESVLSEIEKKVSESVRPITLTWGTATTSFVIKSFEAPLDVKQKLLEMWSTRYASRTAVIGAEGDRDATLTRLQADEAITIRSAEAERIAQLTKLHAERQRVIRLADADRLAIEAKAEGERYALLETGKARAQAEAELIRAKGEAESDSVVKKAASEETAAAHQAKARKAAAMGEEEYIERIGAAQARARREIGKAEAEARAAMFREILAAIRPSGHTEPMDKETIAKIAQDLSTRVGLHDAINYLSAIAGGRMQRLSLAAPTEDEEDRPENH